jgi:DNA-binding GntR family transcriptional regulator
MERRKNEFSDTSAADLSELRPSDVDRKAPLRDQIYELLRMRIIIGQLRPGQVVNEIEIARQLGVSRTPVREAVKRIGDEGLIVVRAQNGTFVSEFSREALDEAYLIRTALEVESVKKAVANLRPRDLERLEDIIVAHEAAIRRARYAEAIRLDDMFHRQIAEASGLTMLWRAVDISKAQMDRGRHLALPHPGMGEVTLAQHREILDALQSRDKARAVRAIKDHLGTSLSNTLVMLDRELEQAPAEGSVSTGPALVPQPKRQAAAVAIADAQLEAPGSKRRGRRAQ